MKVSIVIPAFNEEKLLPATLRAVQAALPGFTERGWTSEVVVCDNNSTDRTAEVARAAGVQVVFEPVNQIGRARNTGAAAATGDWLLFIDADSRPDRALFAAAAAEAEGGRSVAVGTTVRLDSGGWVLRALAGVWNGVSRIGRMLAGSFILVNRDVFRQVGGFSADLFAAEELDLTRRLKAVARERGQRVVVLHRTPLETSGRKAELYSGWELTAFAVKSIFRPFSTLTRREACSPWYDGRR